MLQLIKIELLKILTKPRSFIGFAAITAIVAIIQFALFVDGKNYLSFITQQIEQSFILQGNILNGNLVAFIILQTLIVQMPLLVALVTGDLVSGETASGTIRLLLTKPFTRGQILFAKLFAGSVYTLLLILWLGVLALVGGWILFGKGDLIVLSSDHISILQQADVLWRFMAALVVAFISLSVVSAFSLMLSCFTDNSIVPIVACMTIIIIFTIIGTMDIPLFDYVKPFLFTTHMIIWRNLFEDPLPKMQIIKSISIMLIYIFVFLFIGFTHFNRKDIQA